ncbi:MAG: hypothetical protein JJU28_07610 [Cyclobacteriaceae bacterium]|nr:hypothetical protein [Cyclobacteriaceae bacterium]
MRLKLLLKLCLLFIFTGLFTSCQDFSQDFEILRFPLIRADVEGDSWTALEHSVFSLGKIVAFDESAGESEIILERIILTGFSSADRIEKLQITLDISDRNALRGTFTSQLAENGRIRAVEWVMENPNRAGSYLTYQLCNPENARFIIERQNRTEEIISGTFEFDLCRINIPEESIRIDRGEFRDLSYKLR